MEIVFNRAGLVAHVVACSKIQTVYLWGGIGNKITENTILKLKSMYPQKYNEEYYGLLKTYIGKGFYGFDCSGLIKHYFMGGFANYKYNPKLDWNTKMMFDRSTIKGEIKFMPDVPGTIVYMEGHVGVYIGGGCVIESTPAFRVGGGVQKTYLDEREWTNWFQHSLFGTI
jgi:cell wall-associated NlpC family hydrolase